MIPYSDTLTDSQFIFLFEVILVVTIKWQVAIKYMKPEMERKDESLLVLEPRGIKDLPHFHVEVKDLLWVLGVHAPLLAQRLRC